jgi:GNAT superfamily N-acetyltransferase
MTFRPAKTTDISQMQLVRNSVLENVLSNPSLVTYKDYEEFLDTRGKGWVCEISNQIVGFAIADLKDDNIWALFILPHFEHQGIGKKLHDMMLDWYFSTDKKKVWLGTAPKTRAYYFYRKAGWTETGTHGNGETKFEMTKLNWERIKKKHLP